VTMAACRMARVGRRVKKTSGRRRFPDTKAFAGHGKKAVDKGCAGTSVAGGPCLEEEDQEKLLYLKKVRVVHRKRGDVTARTPGRRGEVLGPAEKEKAGEVLPSPPVKGHPCPARCTLETGQAAKSGGPQECLGRSCSIKKKKKTRPKLNPAVLGGRKGGREPSAQRKD